MTSAVTRSSRSSTRKSSATDNSLQKTVTSTLFKKKKQRINKDRSKRLIEEEHVSEEEIGKQNELLLSGKTNAADHPEYQKMMERLDQSYQERLQRIEAWRNYDYQTIHECFEAQKKQADDDYHFARMKVRSDLIQNVQMKITRLKQELTLLNRQTKTQYLPDTEDYQDWVPPDRLHTIGSFVGGATNEEIDRDLMHAKQPYNPSNTPHLIYSDYESKSTTDTVEEEESPTKISSSSSSNSENYQEHIYLPPINHSNFATTNHNNMLPYPPYELEETPQSRPDWWPYRSTTTA